ASCASSSPTFGPIVSIPLSSTPATSASSRSPTSGHPRRTSGPPLLKSDPHRASCDGRLSCPVPRDRPLEAFVELHSRLPPEYGARLLDVRDAQLDVGVVQRLEHDLAGRVAEPLDPLREVVDRDRRARVANVERLADCVGMLE